MTFQRWLWQAHRVISREFVRRWWGKYNFWEFTAKIRRDDKWFWGVRISNCVDYFFASLIFFILGYVFFFCEEGLRRMIECLIGYTSRYYSISFFLSFIISFSLYQANFLIVKIWCSKSCSNCFLFCPAQRVKALVILVSAVYSFLVSLSFFPSSASVSPTSLWALMFLSSSSTASRESV
jgi:hypothetical protein